MVVKTPVELGWYKILSNCGVVKLKIEKKFESSSRQHERYKHISSINAEKLYHFSSFYNDFTAIRKEYFPNSTTPISTIIICRG